MSTIVKSLHSVRGKTKIILRSTYCVGNVLSLFKFPVDEIGRASVSQNAEALKQGLIDRVRAHLRMILEI